MSNIPFCRTYHENQKLQHFSKWYSKSFSPKIATFVGLHTFFVFFFFFFLFYEQTLYLFHSSRLNVPAGSSSRGSFFFGSTETLCDESLPVCPTKDFSFATHIELGIWKLNRCTSDKKQITNRGRKVIQRNLRTTYLLPLPTYIKTNKQRTNPCFGSIFIEPGSGRPWIRIQAVLKHYLETIIRFPIKRSQLKD